MHLVIAGTSHDPGVTMNSRPIRLMSETYLVTRMLGILPIGTLPALETHRKQQV